MAERERRDRTRKAPQKKVPRSRDGQTVVALLRLKNEPCRYYDEMQIHDVLVSCAGKFMDGFEDFYLKWNQNKHRVNQPRKQIYTTPGVKGDLRLMPCFIRDAQGKLIRVVKVIGTNEEESVIQDKISVGKALLINARDHFVEAIFDVAALSSFRSAAISVLAFKHFGGGADRKDRTIGLVGLGRIGFYTALLLHQWLRLNELTATDIRRSQISRFRKAAAVCFPGLRITIASLERLCPQCSAIFLGTNSQTPVLSAKTAAHARFISSVGADADNLSELDSSLIHGRRILTDSAQSMLLGDLKRWAVQGLVARKNLREIRTYIRKRRLPSEPTLFISTGVALQDALVCQFLFELTLPRFDVHHSTQS